MEDETQESSHRLIGDLGDRLLSKNTCPENVNLLSYRGRFLCLITARRRKKSDAVTQFFD